MAFLIWPGVPSSPVGCSPLWGTTYWMKHAQQYLSCPNLIWNHWNGMLPQENDISYKLAIKKVNNDLNNFLIWIFILELKIEILIFFVTMSQADVNILFNLLQDSLLCIWATLGCLPDALSVFTQLRMSFNLRTWLPARNDPGPSYSRHNVNRTNIHHPQQPETGSWRKVVN